MNIKFNFQDIVKPKLYIFKKKKIPTHEHFNFYKYIKNI